MNFKDLELKDDGSLLGVYKNERLLLGIKVGIVCGNYPIFHLTAPCQEMNAMDSSDLIGIIKQNFGDHAQAVFPNT